MRSCLTVYTYIHIHGFKSEIMMKTFNEMIKGVGRLLDGMWQKSMLDSCWSFVPISGMIRPALQKTGSSLLQLIIIIVYLTFSKIEKSTLIIGYIVLLDVEKYYVWYYIKIIINIRVVVKNISVYLMRSIKLSINKHCRR